jgi:hypothetical protein
MPGQQAHAAAAVAALVARCAETRVRSPVGDGDDIDRVGRIDMPVPDPHRPVLVLNLKGDLSHLELSGWFDSASTGTLGDRHATSPISARK